MSNPFSQKSDQYARFRPGYPDELLDFVAALPENRGHAWDVGTGNGQFAVRLADYFTNVYATDVSPEQIGHAPIHSRIFYTEQPAEKTNFDDSFFDLITVAQAVHWFDFDKFYAEVNRTLKPNGYIVVIGYGLLRITPAINSVIDEFYAFTGSFWDPQRKYLDEHYRTIPFPFDEIKVPEFSFNVKFSLEQLVGFLNTWSAVKHFIKSECYNPVDELFPHLKHSWGDVEFHTVNFPLFVRVGKKF